jgi:DNA-binding CsgD family transcriptional regulator
VIHLGAETIKSYRKSIAMKLESKNITHSVVIAMKQGWL